MGIDREAFYDESRIAIVPMGLCYPGRNDAGGDKPPIAECAPLWHPRILPLLENVRLTLLIGRYAQRFHLGAKAGRTVAETVAAWRDFLPRRLPLPHPSWRTTAWERQRPWFRRDLLPELQKLVRRLL